MTNTHGNTQPLVKMALELTGATEASTNSNWQITPDDWDCPICRRSKLHIFKIANSGTMVGNLVNHHDHIITYAKNRTKQFILENNNTHVLTEKESWFVGNKISEFVSRFPPTLVCDDCNNADPIAKSFKENTCKYFSFSPSEISFFIQPEPHSRHSVIFDRVEEVFEKIEDEHAYRKNLCDVLIQRMLDNNRIWGEIQRAPNSKHFMALKKLSERSNVIDSNLLVELDTNGSFSGSAISKALNKIEKKRHARNSLSDTEKFEKKEQKKSRREVTRKKIEAGNYFDHGEPWTHEKTNNLRIAYQENPDIDFLSQKFGRTPGGIKSKLKALGFELY